MAHYARILFTLAIAASTIGAKAQDNVLIVAPDGSEHRWQTPFSALTRAPSSGGWSATAPTEMPDAFTATHLPEEGWSALGTEPTDLSANEEPSDGWEAVVQPPPNPVAEALNTGSLVRFNDVLFATGSHILTDAAQPTLYALYGALVADPNLRLLIIGHTDSVGSEADNMALSQRRANSVAAALEALGVSPSRLIQAARGEAEPVFSNDSAEGRQGNRRVDVTAA